MIDFFAAVIIVLAIIIGLGYVLLPEGFSLHRLRQYNGNTEEPRVKPGRRNPQWERDAPTQPTSGAAEDSCTRYDAGADAEYDAQSLLLQYCDGDGGDFTVVVPPDRSPYTIGRKRDNDLCLHRDGYMSKYHVQLIYDKEGWSMVDTGNRNLIKVGSQRKKTLRLYGGERFILGCTEFQCKRSPAAHQASTIPVGRL